MGNISVEMHDNSRNRFALVADKLQEKGVGKKIRKWESRSESNSTITTEQLRINIDKHARTVPVILQVEEWDYKYQQYW